MRRDAFLLVSAARLREKGLCVDMDELLGSALLPLGQIPELPSDQLRGTLTTLCGLIASLQAEVACGGDGGGALWKYALRQRSAIEKELHERQAKERIMAMLNGTDMPLEDYTAEPAPAPASAAEPAMQMGLPQPPAVTAVAPPYASPSARRPRPRTREQEKRRQGGPGVVVPTSGEVEEATTSNAATG